jgi:hypothetical protein
MMPQVVYAVFQEDNLYGIFNFCRCGTKQIVLDCFNTQSFSCRLRTIAHEVTHYFTSFLPEKLCSFIDTCLDITDGNNPCLLYQEREDIVVLYKWL